MEYTTEQSEKPFEYVPLSRNAPARHKPVTHEKYAANTLSGWLAGQIVAVGPLHIGSGLLESTQPLEHRLSRRDRSNFSLIRSFVTSQGKRIIPGSSLKGAIRSLVEGLSESCVCKIANRGYLDNREQSECRVKENLCPACRIFGAMGFQGRVKFSDAVQAGDRGEVRKLPQLYRPQTRFPDGRKFYYHGRQAEGDQPVEVVPEDSQFSFRLDFENLQAAEMGLLLLGLGLTGQAGGASYRVKLGGFKPACFGSVEFAVERVVLNNTSQTASLEYDLLPANEIDGEALNDWYTEHVKVAIDGPGALVVAKNYRQLSKILAFPGDRDCPTGMY